jgi:hypothetical protein
LIRQFRSVNIIVVVERSVSHLPEAEDATEESIDMTSTKFVADRALGREDNG